MNKQIFLHLKIPLFQLGKSPHFYFFWHTKKQLYFKGKNEPRDQPHQPNTAGASKEPDNRTDPKPQTGTQLSNTRWTHPDPSDAQPLPGADSGSEPLFIKPS
jgi:hypothetical protein